MSRFVILGPDEHGRQHYVNVDHITRVTYYTKAPTPHAYVGFSDGQEGVYIKSETLEQIMKKIEGAKG